MRCSRHAGPVASHCRFAPMFASARPPCRRPFDFFSDCISAVRCTKFSRLTKSDVHNQLHKGRQRGRFFRAKAQKKIAPDGRPKRVFKLQECQPGRMVRPKRVFNCRDANQAGWFGQSATSKYRGVHAMPVRSPLTAASRQCSRRPARHVVIRSEIYSGCISESRYSVNIYRVK